MVAGSTQTQLKSRLAAENIVVRFGGLDALSNVTISFDRTEILGLIGPNGAGKTTLVNCLTGFQNPTSGKILLAGQSIAGKSPRFYRRAGVSRTYQAGRLFKDMTVLENVEVAAVALGMARRNAERAAFELLDWLGLAEKTRRAAGSLPYTDERRVGIARALVCAPGFLLMDEPAAGMSDAECDEIMEVISMIPKTFGCGIMLIEHNMRVVVGVCDKLHVLDGGRTVTQGTPGSVTRDPAVISAYLGARAPSRERDHA